MISGATLDNMGIDHIEAAKREFHQNTGRHLNITLHRDRVAITLTDKPIRPIMLPIAKVGRVRRAINKVTINVKKG